MKTNASKAERLAKYDGIISYYCVKLNCADIDELLREVITLKDIIEKYKELIKDKCED